MARSLENFKQKQSDFMSAVELWKKYEHWLIFFVPLGLKGSRTSCDNMQKKIGARTWGSLQFLSVLPASAQAELQTAGSDVGGNRGKRSLQQDGATPRWSNTPLELLCQDSGHRLTGWRALATICCQNLFWKWWCLLMEAVSVLSWGMCACTINFQMQSSTASKRVNFLTF